MTKPTTEHSPKNPPCNDPSCTVCNTERPLPTCDCHEMPEQQEYNGHTRYCTAGLAPKSDEELVEELAAIEHERWADWQSYCHSRGNPDDEGNLVIPKDCIDHWNRQIKTPYAELTEKEKQSDRDQVMRYWPIITTIRQEAEERERTLLTNLADEVESSPLPEDVKTPRGALAAINHDNQVYNQAKADAASLIRSKIK